MSGSEPSLSAGKKKNKLKPIIGYYKFWVVLTYLSVVSAVVGMYYALSGSIGLAVVCLMFCGFCDMLDGPAARRKKRNDREKSYGIQIDALADLVSFGVFPIVIGYAIGSYNMSQGSVTFGMVVGMGIAALYVLAALIRLSYFNVVEIELQNKKEKRKYYEGMPVTFVSILIPLVYSLCLIFDFSFSSLYSVLLFLISIAFVTRVKIPKIRGRYLLVFLLIGLPIAIYLIWSIRA